MKAIKCIILLTLLFSSCNKNNVTKNNKPIVFRDVASNKIDSIDLYSFNRNCDIDTVIPDKVTAVKYAFILLSNIYGEKQIRGEFPLDVSMKDSNWIIEGSLPDGYIGGTAYVSINMKTGTINKIIHFK
jgi:hypothetical protein